jgi:LytS/YehU family sensor histidine kinase
MTALYMFYFDWVSDFINGRRALPWNAIPKGALEVVSALPSPRTGLDLYISPRLVAWAVISTALWFLLARFNTHLAETKRQERLRREAEDTALRGRMAPAVVFNALDTIKAQVAREPREAAATTDRLASLFRQVVELTDRPLVTVREEVAFIETYLGIERARLGDRLRVKLEIAESVEERLIPPLSLQALVEDGVRNGVESRKDGGEIRVWARWDGAGSFKKLEVGVESPAAAPGASGASQPWTTLAALRGRLERPTDLDTTTRGERLITRFIWRGAEAWP